MLVGEKHLEERFQIMLIGKNFAEQGEYRGRDLPKRFVCIRMPFIETDNA